LKPYLSSEEEAPAGPEERILNFEPNTTYLLHPDGSRSHNRAISRQAAALAADAFLQAAVEEEAIAAGTLDPETAAALADEHDRAIGLQIKAAEVAQARIDSAYAQAQEAAEREAEPAKPSEFFVKRGAVYRKTEEARLRPGEPVFVKEPSGAWAAVGTTNINGALPPDEVII
jgi:hypothetical protein